MVLYFEARVEPAAETSLTPGMQVRGRTGGLSQALRRGRAVNRSESLHNGAMRVVSEKINTSPGSLALSCGEFLHLSMGVFFFFKDMHFQL